VFVPKLQQALQMPFRFASEVWICAGKEKAHVPSRQAVGLADAKIRKVA